MRSLGKILIPLVLAVGVLLVPVAPALACGGLVAPDGAVRLARAATLVAWHGGVEHYMTSFTYTGNEKNIGWIVPLPAVPDSIQEGGAWTLQRLSREVTPPAPVAFNGSVAADSAAGVTVLQQVTIEALNITVVKGSGQDVLNWAASNGFFINADTRAHLLIYAQASPIFMTAKFDTSIIQQRHETEGDGTPLLITMHLAHPWVPLEVLALDDQQVNADLYFLTDMPLNTSDFAATVGQSPVGSEIPGATGFTVKFQEPMNASLYHDLSTDRNMSWVRSDGWLTYLSLNAPYNTVTYDLGVTSRGVIRLATFGTNPMSIGSASTSPTWVPELPIGTPQILLIVLLGVAVWLALFLLIRHQRRLDHTPTVASTGSAED
jgi:hypothetical protein